MADVLQFVLILGGIVIASLLTFIGVMVFSLLGRTVWEDFRNEFLRRDK